jgi:hypothetical protein
MDIAKEQEQAIRPQPMSHQVEMTMSLMLHLTGRRFPEPRVQAPQALGVHGERSL